MLVLRKIESLKNTSKVEKIKETLFGSVLGSQIDVL